MVEKLPITNISRITNAHSRTVGRRNHAEKRLEERFGLDYIKVKNVIDNGGAKFLLKCTNNDEIYHLPYLKCDIYFIIRSGEIKTFLTKEMTEISFPEIFDPPKKEKTKERRDPKGKKKRKQPQLIPASELFKEDKNG